MNAYCSPSEEAQEASFPPLSFIVLTKRNENNLIFDKQNNVISRDGSEWSGGTSLSRLANQLKREYLIEKTLGWNRHDQDINNINGSLIDKDGNIEQSFDMVFASQQLSGICNPNRKCD